MADKKGNEGKTDKVIILGDGRRTEIRKDAGYELPSTPLIVDNLAIADAKLKTRQAETIARTTRDDVLNKFLESGDITEDQIRIDEETDECFINVNGEEMELSEFYRHLKRIRMDEESTLRQDDKEVD